MGRDIVIPTPCGPIGAWRAAPPNGEVPFGAVIVLQEIFGVNEHIRSVTDRFAASGYLAVAPALFDPVARNVELGYDEAGFAHGRELVTGLGTDRAVKLIDATAGQLRSEGFRKIAAIGFCWGGSLAFLANTRLGLPAVSYYGARTMPFLAEPLQAPMLFHFGERDPTTPVADIDAHRRQHPEADVRVYPTGHGFNRDVDPRHFDADCASLAWRRTLDFLKTHLR